MIWFWANIPACAAVFTATTGIPLWLVLKRPDAPHSKAPSPAAARPASTPADARHERPLQLTH